MVSEIPRFSPLSLSCLHLRIRKPKVNIDSATTYESRMKRRHR